MIFYYNNTNDIKIQSETLLKNLEKQISPKTIQLKILLACLTNVNDIIQNSNTIENPKQLIVFLEELKPTLDEIRSELSDLQGLHDAFMNILPELLSSQMIEENLPLLENLNKYNELALKYQNKFLKIRSHSFENFILTYMESTEFNFIVSSHTNSSLTNINENNTVSIKSSDKSISNFNIADNKVLLISEVQGKVILPYTVSDLEKKLNNNSEYKNLQEVIDGEYTLPLSRYKNASLSRFKEAYSLMRKVEQASVMDSLDLALELMFNSLLNPAIITACKNLDELDIYLDCLSSNELDKFKIFEIKYEITPF